MKTPMFKTRDARLAYAATVLSMTAVEHLQRALEAMQVERDDLDRSMSALHELIEHHGGTSQSDKGGVNDSNGEHAARLQLPSPHLADYSSAPSVREVALELARDRGIFTLEQLTIELKARGNDAKDSSVSSLMSRMKRANELETGPRRGTYVLPSPKTPEPPASTGGSDTGKEVADEDHDQDFQPSDHHHRDPPVTGDDLELQL